MVDLKGNKAVRLKAEADAFHSVIESLKWFPRIQTYVSAIRNTYNAVQEAPDWSKEQKSIRETAHAVWRQTLGYLIRTPSFKPKSEITLLAVHPLVDDPVSQLSQIPITPIEWKRKKTIGNILANLSLLLFPAVSILILLSFKTLKRRAILASWPDMLDYTLARNKLSIENLKVLITQRDRYGSEIGLIRKAKAMGIPTVKVDYYSPLDAFCQNTIEAEYFFYPNENNRGIYERYRQNKKVKFVSGGLPKWDLIARHKHQPQLNPKIVLFMGQYDTQQFTGIDESFYVEKILTNLPEGYQLYFKPHPSEEFDRYRRFENQNVRLIKHGEIDNYELIAKSTICFSIYSAMLYEAKHLCERSYVINFYPERAPHVEYQFLNQYVDLISDEKALRAALNGDIRPIAIKDFVSRFNPRFPYSSLALKDFALKLSEAPLEDYTFNMASEILCPELPSISPQ